MPTTPATASPTTSMLRATAARLRGAVPPALLDPAASAAETKRRCDAVQAAHPGVSRLDAWSAVEADDRAHRDAWLASNEAAKRAHPPAQPTPAQLAGALNATIAARAAALQRATPGLDYSTALCRAATELSGTPAARVVVAAHPARDGVSLEHAAAAPAPDGAAAGEPGRFDLPPEQAAAAARNRSAIASADLHERAVAIQRERGGGYADALKAAAYEAEQR